MLISPQGIKYYSAFRFQFSCSNNTAEYEALIHGLHWAMKKGIKNLQVFGDSELIVNQVRGQHATKNDLLKNYKNMVWDLIEDFEAFNIVSIPRKKMKPQIGSQQLEQRLMWLTTSKGKKHNHISM